MPYHDPKTKTPRDRCFLFTQQSSNNRTHVSTILERPVTILRQTYLREDEVIPVVQVGMNVCIDRSGEIQLRLVNSKSRESVGEANVSLCSLSESLASFASSLPRGK